MPDFDEICERCFREQYKADLNSERFTSLPQEEQYKVLFAARARNKEWMEKTRSRLEERDVQLALNGTFHPSNKHSRLIFTLVTGITLPSTSTGTRAAVADYIGQDKIDAHYAEKEAIRQAEHDRATMQAIADKIKRGEPVTGDQLVDCCRYLGVELHPRTAGTLRKRVVEIGAGSARIRGNGLGNLPYKAYADCAKAA